MSNSSLLLRIPVKRSPAKRSTQTVPAAPVVIPRDALSLDRLKTLLESFLMRGDIERHSPATLTNHRYRVGRLVWLAEKRGWQTVGYPELQKFFLYLNHAHEEAGGRWDNPRETEGLKPGSVKSFHLSIRAFFRWCVAEGELDTCPVDKIGSPIDRPDQIQPLTEAQADACVAAAKRTSGGKTNRDEAIILLLVDCGLRVSELCALRIGDIDFAEGSLLIREGKGGKGRSLPFGRRAKRALWDYTHRDRRGANDAEPLFISERGQEAGVSALTRRGVALLVGRVGKKAHLPPTVRCSPHTFRHTFACMMLRNGANIFALKAALGHTSMAMVNKYLALSQADLVAAHRLSSPPDRLKDTKGRR